MIVVMQKGEIVERGTNAELMSKGEEGVYYQLRKQQEVVEEEENPAAVPSPTGKPLDTDAVKVWRPPPAGTAAAIAQVCLTFPPAAGAAVGRQCCLCHWRGCCCTQPQ